MGEPYLTTERVLLHAGDCLDVLRELPDASVDAVVTDPPYGLGFMGREWDGLPPGRPWAEQCLRVLKPGGHLLAFGGTRTWHRLACAVEDAGFEIRDSIAWMYGSGFPKSLDVSKAIDKAAGVERPVVAEVKKLQSYGSDARGPVNAVLGGGPDKGGVQRITEPATAAAAAWSGWGTALKPAFEPIVVARKPLAGTVAGNVLAHGTGALNVDGCRVESDGEHKRPFQPTNNDRDVYGAQAGFQPTNAEGRWPANVILDESQAAVLDEQSGVQRDGVAVQRNRGATKPNEVYGGGWGNLPNDETYGGEGGASRFFYVAQGDDEQEREWLCPLCGRPAHDYRCGAWPPFLYTPKADASERVRVNGTAHPTVKPLSLMRWLVRLVTPPGGTVLEPFAGSGTTVEACLLEGFHCIAIEREADYLPLIVQRINRRRDPVAAVKAAAEDGGLFDLLGEETA